MEENKIDQVIVALSKIESTAVGIQEESEKEKNEYYKFIGDKIKEFDENLIKEHKANMLELTKNLEMEKEEELSAMREETQVLISFLDKAYQQKHEQWAKDILNQLIKE